MLSVIAAVNDDAVLANCLGRSPLLTSGAATLTTITGAVSASVAYNEGLDRTSDEIVVFAHQDVYLPGGWDATLLRTITQLPERWAVLGVYGVAAAGAHVGCVWSQGLGRQLGAQFDGAQPVASVDELLIVVRRSSGIRFDDELPSFHLYGTDIVQTALAAGRDAFVFSGPVIHNSLPVRRLDAGFCDAYRHLQRKWSNDLPIPTTVAPLATGPWALARMRLRRRRPGGMTQRDSDCARLAQELSYEEVAA